MIYNLLDIIVLHAQVLTVMHARDMELLLHGVLLTSLAALIIRSTFSAQNLLLIVLLFIVHPKLISLQTIPPGDIPESHRFLDAASVVEGHQRNTLLPEEAGQLLLDTTDPGPAPCGPSTSDERLNRDIMYEVADRATDVGSPFKAYCSRYKVRKGLTTFTENKENEPSPYFLNEATKATPTGSCGHGSKPLTSTGSLSRIMNVATGTRLTAPLSNATQGVSSSYSSGGMRDVRSSSLVSSVGKFTRRASLPSDYLGHIRTGVILQLQGDTNKLPRLQGEMKLTARLRNGPMELRDQACTKLDPPKQQAEYLAEAVDSRAMFIKEHTFKFATSPDPSYKVRVGNDARGSPFQSNAWELGQKNNNLTLQEGISARRRMLTQCSSDISLGSVLEPKLEPPRGNNISATQTFDTPICEYTYNDESISKEDLEVEFPTISPRFPPRYYATVLARSKVNAPSPRALIYEVDGRTLVTYGNHPHFCLGSLSDSATVRSGAHLFSTRDLGSAHRNATDIDAHYRGASACIRDYLAMLEDSPLYAVAASAFVLPCDDTLCP